MTISRRVFLVKSAGTIAVLSTSGLVSTIINSCGGNNPSGPSNVSTMNIIQGTVSNNEITLSIAAPSPIADKNTRAVVEYNNGGGALLVEHNSDDTFRAVSGICTHQGCIVTDFDGTSNVFVCPCHGSRFDLTGNVIQGPAPSRLVQYSTRVANNSLIITL
jgi:cytochrome b6-f complex iron-sulfur subunit